MHKQSAPVDLFPGAAGAHLLSAPCSRSQAEPGPGKAGRRNLTNLSPEQRAKLRAEQNRQAKAASRARAASLGDRKIEILVSAGELALLQDLRGRQRGPLEGFYRRALVIGATFLANAGNPRGRKVKGNSGAAAIKGTFADMSAKPHAPGAPATWETPDSAGCPPVA